MRDQITELCTRLLRAEEPAEVQPVEEQLQDAIRERVERVRNDAIRIAMIERMVDLDFLTTPPAKEKPN
jgi:hypothetical protein